VNGEGRYLDDYARELAEEGERAFRKQHAAPVLIVTGKRARKARRGSGVDTVTDRPTLHGLLHRVFPLAGAAGEPEGPVVVGRAEGDGIHVIIPEASISKKHCTFAADGGGVVLSDCGSTNGTSVNGEPVAATPVRLAGGETISLGRLQLTFETASGFVELVGAMRPR
jgi:FHA domain-containing protein